MIKDMSVQQLIFRYLLVTLSRSFKNYFIMKRTFFTKEKLVFACNVDQT